MTRAARATGSRPAGSRRRTWWKCSGVSGDATGPVPFSSYMTTRRFLRDERETVVRFTRALYRAYNNGFPTKDSNHRFALDMATLQPLVAQGWVIEGAVMCVQG